MEVAKEEVIATICTSNRSLSLLRENFLLKCTYNSLNIETKRLIRIAVVKVIGKNLRTKIKDKGSISQRKIDLVHERRSKKSKRRKGRDRHLSLRRTLNKLWNKLPNGINSFMINEIVNLKSFLFSLGRRFFFYFLLTQTQNFQVFVYQFLILANNL